MKNLFSLLFLFAAITGFSQQNTRIPSIEITNKNDKPIELKKLKISVFVIENIATTTLEMDFYNANNRIMEGKLDFPLGNGVTVSRFALDVNGEMREGVVVDKEKATQAFEAVSRQKVDPGIVEVTKGNNFKARVYPIPANAYKKAIIAFEQKLETVNGQYLYELPLNITNELAEFNVKAEVVMSKPKVKQSTHPSINLQFTQARNSYISEYAETNVILDNYLSFAIPTNNSVKEIIPYKGSVTNNNFFYIHKSFSEQKQAKVKPTKVTILWDASSSTRNRNIKKEIEILQKYVKWMNSGTIEFITFANTLLSQDVYDITNGTCNEMFDCINLIDYDGATNMYAVNISKIKTTETLLFSDGLHNFGNIKNYNTSTNISTINSANIADHNLLEWYSRSTKGTYINAFTLTSKEAINQLTNESLRLIKVDYDNNQIQNIYPQIGTAINKDFSCAGKILTNSAQVTLHFGYNSKITESVTYTINTEDLIDNNVGERIWAQMKLKELLVENNAVKIKEHGKKFSLVTPGTSLIVLDAVSDYVRYKIVPQKSLQKEYYTILEQQHQLKINAQENRINSICNQFKEDITWWENVKDYRNTPIEQEKKELNKSNRAEELQIRETDSEIMYDMVAAPEEEAIEQIAVSGYASGVQVSANSGSFKADKAPKTKATITIKKWESNAEYMVDIKAANKDSIYECYLGLKPKYGKNPSLYFDVATYLIENNQRELGLRVISNLAELELESPELLRTLGRKLYEYKFYEEALFIFNEVLKARSFEPHCYIDLGYTLYKMGKNQEAIETLYKVIENDWDADIINRFNGIEVIVLHDINNIIQEQNGKLNTAFINPCFIKNMPVDIRILIDWDANDTDIDLWITDPRKERCSYSNKNTRIGGRMSNDMTQGLGSEEFRLKYAVDGDYKIDVNFYGTRKQTLLENVTVRAIVYTNFGKANQEQQILTLQLEPKKSGDFTVGTINFTTK